MLGEVVDLKTCCDTSELVEFLYNIFRLDFIESSTFLADKIYVDPISNDKQDGKESIFWHVITRKVNGKRMIDEPRACRIVWIKPIVINYAHSAVKMFYYYEDTKKIRLYLWVPHEDFIVILQKLGETSSYLVTSFLY